MGCDLKKCDVSYIKPTLAQQSGLLGPQMVLYLSFSSRCGQFSAPLPNTLTSISEQGTGVKMSMPCPSSQAGSAGAPLPQLNPWGSL